MAPSYGITIRVATPDDARALRRLATLDGARRLTGHVLLAEAGDVPLAAVSLETGALATDPLRNAADLVRVLRLHRYQLARQGGHRPLPSSWHRTLHLFAHEQQIDVHDHVPAGRVATAGVAQPAERSRTSGGQVWGRR